jgi:hypothetical protein
MGALAAIGIFLIANAVQLALETSSEITAETFSDNDVGIVGTPIQISADGIVNISPDAMIVVH